jgi:hypothetical protein
MSTDLLKLFGGSSMEEHPGTLADRLVAAEFAVKFQNDLGVKRRTKLCGHAIDPPVPMLTLHRSPHLLKMLGVVIHKRNRRHSSCGGFLAE